LTVQVRPKNEDLKVKAKMHVFNENVVLKKINSKRRPGEVIEIPEQQVAVQLDGDRFPKEGVIGLPRMRNGVGFKQGVYDVPVALHTNNFGGFELQLDLNNATAVGADATKPLKAA
jgi:hypothetical protein